VEHGICAHLAHLYTFCALIDSLKGLCLLIDSLLKDLLYGAPINLPLREKKCRAVERKCSLLRIQVRR
jgi:hypothetical protein